MYFHETEILMIITLFFLLIKDVHGYVGTCNISLGDEKHEEPYVVLLISFSMVLMVIVQQLLKITKLPISHTAVISIIGFLIGILANYVNCINEYTRFIELPQYSLIAFVVPILIFKIGFCVDAHTFLRSCSQILLISIIGLLANATIIGFIMSLIKMSTWKYCMVYMFGAVASPVYTQDVVGMLKDMGYQAKHLVTLLDGETMIGLAIAVMLFNCMDDMVLMKDTDVAHICLMMFWSLLIGPAVGFLIGKVTVAIIQIRYNSIVQLMLWTWTLPMLGYYICEKFIHTSGILCVIIIGLMVGAERHAFPTEVDQILLQFWTLFANLIYTLLIFFYTMYAARNLEKIARTAELAGILLTYILVHVSRFVTIISMSPILSRLGYGFTLSKLVVMLWSNVKGPIPVVLASKGLDNFYGSFGVTLFCHMAGITMLSLFINVSTMRMILKLLDMSQLTMARINNMDNCVRYVMARRERSIAMLKMDRFLSDANWPLVQKATIIAHPYRRNFRGDGDMNDQEEVAFARITTCPDCNKEITAEPTPRELYDMTREARLRILKAKKISYTRQYENRLLSKDAIRLLTATVELASDTEEALIQLDGLIRLFSRKGIAYHMRKQILKLFFKKSTTFSKQPKYRCRRVCRRIIIHPAHEWALCTIILLNLIPLVIEFCFVGKNKNYSWWLELSGAIMNCIFFLVYLADFVLKIYGNAWLYIWDHGVKTYFRSYWNMVEFVLLIFSLSLVVMDILDHLFDFDVSSEYFVKFLCVVNALRIFRLVKLLPLNRAWYPKLVKYCDRGIDSHMAFAYEIGKGFVTAEQEIIDKLHQMINNNQIREDMRRRLDKDRMLVTRELGLIQKEKAWIAITVKTKQAMRSTINSMIECVSELKLSGWVDDFEYMKLNNLLQERLKVIGKIKAIQPSEPKVIFSEVSWMKGDTAVSEFLYRNVRTKVFDEGDIVCSEGELSEGIFILVTGILKLSYEPNERKLNNFYSTGCLPVLDYLSTTDFEEQIEDYFLTGNAIGVLSTLTDRPYDCNIVADTPSQVFVLNRKDVKKAIKDSKDPIRGMECKMWKSLTQSLALYILSDVPSYQSYPTEKIKMCLERAFVPNLRNYKILTINEYIEDVILLEGVVSDQVTRDDYFAPCYIPRTVQKLILSQSSQAQIQGAASTKLMIIPVQEVDQYTMMARAEDVSELVSTSSSKCLQHNIQDKMLLSNKRRKKNVSVTDR